jgi:hypothetical protein
MIIQCQASKRRGHPLWVPTMRDIVGVVSSVGTYEMCPYIVDHPMPGAET